MDHELKVFIFAAAVIAFAYVAIYPRMTEKTLNRMMVLDLGLSAVLVVIVGLLYYGSGIRFSMVLFTVPWWVFTLLSAAIVEIPFFIWFCKKWDIDLSPPSD
ncbi:hypothetical protein [Sulfitobacter donghicola]|uniref:Uncharacterized protein n=1 Tax=Sulfitobacter donghicola DSW-25 = KCTC 12864 = JCM 14565 TaxID=1300350 RepID=A0A073ISH9_9RHOB|nr:hypothetical protein [Sulfitobacter donghicola]KEJ88352.1 hypothetical protein DSW25_14720 [Sulfitobacter donghicola DSW-25 = KCTC 12864 = JCM 14565]KIN69787.1 hypothetical protein Z948_3536 [Sulfitobacter donghicola DSW-25 = KCTC 12864 = JCM 14565]